MMAFRTTALINGNPGEGGNSPALPGQLTDDLKAWLKEEVNLTELADALNCTRYESGAGYAHRREISVAELRERQYQDDNQWVRFFCPWREDSDSNGFVVCDDRWYDHVKKEGGDVFSFVQRLIAFRREVELNFPQTVALTICLAEVSEWEIEDEKEEKMRQSALEFSSRQQLPDKLERADREEEVAVEEEVYQFQPFQPKENQ